MKIFPFQLLCVSFYRILRLKSILTPLAISYHLSLNTKLILSFGNNFKILHPSRPYFYSILLIICKRISTSSSSFFLSIQLPFVVSLKDNFPVFCDLPYPIFSIHLFSYYCSVVVSMMRLNDKIFMRKIDFKQCSNYLTNKVMNFHFHKKIIMENCRINAREKR